MARGRRWPGITGAALVNYAGELPISLDEMMPRLERMGLREKRGG